MEKIVFSPRTTRAFLVKCTSCPKIWRPHLLSKDLEAVLAPPFVASMSEASAGQDDPDETDHESLREYVDSILASLPETNETLSPPLQDERPRRETDQFSNPPQGDSLQLATDHLSSPPQDGMPRIEADQLSNLHYDERLQLETDQLPSPPQDGMLRTEAGQLSNLHYDERMQLETDHLSNPPQDGSPRIEAGQLSNPPQDESLQLERDQLSNRPLVDGRHHIEAGQFSQPPQDKRRRRLETDGMASSNQDNTLQPENDEIALLRQQLELIHVPGVTIDPWHPALESMWREWTETVSLEEFAWQSCVYGCLMPKRNSQQTKSKTHSERKKKARSKSNYRLNRLKQVGPEFGFLLDPGSSWSRYAHNRKLSDEEVRLAVSRSHEAWKKLKRLKKHKRLRGERVLEELKRRFGSRIKRFIDTSIEKKEPPLGFRTLKDVNVVDAWNRVVDFISALEESDDDDEDSEVMDVSKRALLFLILQCEKCHGPYNFSSQPGPKDDKDPENNDGDGDGDGSGPMGDSGSALVDLET